MKERPILFSAPMVRAILDGSKTQTRRVVKPQPERRHIEQVGSMLGFKKREGDGFWLWPNAREKILAESPYGQPGDRLWVREAWAAPHAFDHLPPRLIPAGTRFHYAATDVLGGLRGRPSIHMPRWASRITLEITGVRLERLQDISQADALAEGVAPHSDGKFPNYLSLTGYAGNAVSSYHSLWESLNGPGSWEANPWVWVVSFRSIEAASK